MSNWGKKYIIVIPIFNDNNNICDYVKQTTKHLVDKGHIVYLLDTSKSTHFLRLVVNVFKRIKSYRKKNTQKSFGKTQHKILHTVALIPFNRFSLIATINQYFYFITLQLWLRVKHSGCNCFIIWSFFPSLYSFTKSKLSSWSLLFDVVDYHHSSDSDIYKITKLNRKLLLKKANWIFSISKNLAKLFQPIANNKIFVVPQGFDIGSYQTNSKNININKCNSSNTNKPTVGFLGQISQRIDLSLIWALIKNNIDWQFVFVGPTHNEPNISKNYSNFSKKVTHIVQAKNVVMIESQPRKILKTLIDQFDICIIPYDISQLFNLYCYPMKLFEYFYMGKPVVSTPIKELLLPKFNGLVYTGNTVDEWEKIVQNLLNNDWPKKKAARQRKMAEENSWGKKIGAILNTIDQEY